MSSQCHAMSLLHACLLRCHAPVVALSAQGSLAITPTYFGPSHCMSLEHVKANVYLDMALGSDYQRGKQSKFNQGLSSLWRSKAREKQGPIISAISVEKGLKKGANNFLAAMIEVKPNVKVDLPDSVADLLRQYADVMPPEFLKELPPRSDIDQKIELLPGSVAPAQAPYRMAPKELAELRKQLNELFDASLVQPSKAPY
ncbi:uncharacterized protein LOC124892638, partial [Capsicum annuum]|uniref:uncharacterized protein LOC124892638 n=1 Tax=Capsicum annuum TaxID=4072 RepID=UPI001FB1553A